MNTSKEQEDHIRKNLLGKKKGVTGYSREILPKITGGKVTTRKAIVIYVEKKVKKDELDPKDLVEEEILGTPTDVREIGKVVIE
ncbi:MAG: hypothetical protein V3U49_05960 [Nitrososphaerales archaeon]